MIDGDGAPYALGARRLRRVLLAIGAFWVVACARLVHVQGIDHDLYAHRARTQHEREITVSARRGRILDREGRELAIDVSAVSFYCRPSAVRDPAAVATHFGRFGQRTPESMRELLDSRRPFVYLLRQVEEPELSQVRQRQFAGVFEQPEVRRIYPYGKVAAQLIGFTSIENEGREGVELAFENVLAQRDGSALSLVDGKGNPLPDRSQETEPARNGASVRLTVDTVIQGILEEELARAAEESAAESALGVITDPRTGEVLALASVPLFDPNDPGASPPANRRNRMVTDPFEPGSTMKPITIASVLETGRVRPDTVVYCEEGAFALATGDIIRDTSAHGWLSATEVIAESSNIGAIKLARTLSRAELYESLRAFGFGTRTGVGLPAESAGLLHQARDWSDRSLETIAIGQEISVTALQMVQAFGALANGGTLMAPRVVAEVRGPDGELLRRTEPQAVRRVVSAATAKAVSEMMCAVVQEGGTATKAAIAGLQVAGKTGTAQRALPDGGGYARDEYVASFIGFLPADREPEFLCLIAVENPRRGKFGGTVAAPAFRRTMERVLALRGTPAQLADQTEARAPESQPQVQERIPDLRGLSPASARVQAARRGLVVQLEGDGPLVVDQAPLPRAPRSDDDAIVCRLGDEQSVLPPVTLADAPLRQAVLLAKLAPPALVALVR